MLIEHVATNDILDSLSYVPVSRSPEPQSYPLQPAPTGGVPYVLYRPDTVSENQPPLVLIHGISRNVHQHIDAFSDYARKTGRILIAPLFDESSGQRYQQVLSQKCCADQRLLAVFRDVYRLIGYTFQKIALFGFSGGAQFGHRFAMLYPDRVDRLAIASAGWYTFPDDQARFPYGISMQTRKGRRLRANLQRFLSIPTLVLAGELDIKRDANLRKGSAIDRQQGRSRVERAARWVRAMQSEASLRGIQADINLHILPDSTHDFNRCVRQGSMTTLIAEWLAK